MKPTESRIALLALVLSIGIFGCKSTTRETTPQSAPPNTAQSEAGEARPAENAEAAQSPPAESTGSTEATAGEPKSSNFKPLPQLSSRGATRVEMRNVDFHSQDAIVLRIRTLRGALLRRNSATPPVFDDKRSFVLRIDSGTIGIRSDSLSELMNNYVFAYPKAPLKKIRVTTEGSKLKLAAKMRKVVDVPVRITGDLSTTPDGKLRLHPTSIKAAGIPVKGLLHLFGLDLSEVLKSNEDRGVKLDDDDIIMDPERMMPPPSIRGKITSVRIEGDEVVQVFGPGGKSSGALGKGSNYMYYRGGTLRFGKLTMANADLRIVDADSKNPFDFSIDHYNRQLVAGHSKNTSNYGLVVVMPDYYKLAGGTPSQAGGGGLTDEPTSSKPRPDSRAATGANAPVRQFSFDGNELFDKHDAARLKKEKLLKDAGSFLEANPSDFAEIVAGTPEGGDRQENLDLGRQRALAVRVYLSKKFKVEAERIKSRTTSANERASGSAERVMIYVYPGAKERRVITKQR